MCAMAKLGSCLKKHELKLFGSKVLIQTYFPTEGLCVFSYKKVKEKKYLFQCVVSIDYPGIIVHQQWLTEWKCELLCTGWNNNNYWENC